MDDSAGTIDVVAAGAAGAATGSASGVAAGAGRTDAVATGVAATDRAADGAAADSAVTAAGDAAVDVSALSMWTIVVAAGSGQRFGGRKQYADLGGELVIDRSLRVAASVSSGCVVVLPADAAADELTARNTPDGSVRAVRGGASRAESVRAGLAVVPAVANVICVHDAARPLASPALFRRVRDAVGDGADAAIPGVPVADTIKLVTASSPSASAAASAESGESIGTHHTGAALSSSAGSGESTGVPSAEGAPSSASHPVEVESTLPRERLVAVQTPQAFAAAALRAAHADGGEATDDAALVERAGGRVVVVAGEAHNRKLTAPDDLDWARAWIAVNEASAAAPAAARGGSTPAPSPLDGGVSSAGDASPGRGATASAAAGVAG